MKDSYIEPRSYVVKLKAVFFGNLYYQLKSFTYIDKNGSHVPETLGQILVHPGSGHLRLKFAAEIGQVAG
jgi:hypothetical protein